MEQPNLDYIRSMSGGDLAFEQQLIQIIQKEFPEERTTYTTNFGKKDFAAVAENVHKIKHKISILGLEKAYEMANAYEHNLLENNTEGHVEFEAILDKMQTFISSL